MNQNKILIAPSLLSADFSNLQSEINHIAKAGADWVHVDVMDGHFVNNLTLGAPIVKSLKPVSPLPLDVHLMIEKPEKYIDDFIKAGSDYITIHVESTSKVDECLQQIKVGGAKAGITLRPRTPLDAISPYLDKVDLVLVMTVEPGFGGQSFMTDQVVKIKTLAELRAQNNYNYLIEVDGGINDQTLKECQGVDVVVAGNYIFKNPLYKSDCAQIIRSMKNAF